MHGISEIVSMNREPDRADFRKVLNEFNVTQGQLNEVESSMDHEEAEADCDTYVDQSAIQGKGLFAQRDIHAGESITFRNAYGNWTRAGLFSNHAVHPNSRVVNTGSQLEAIATSDIKSNEEITTNYRQTKGVI